MPVKSLLKKPDAQKLNQAIGLELRASNLYKYFATCMQYKGFFGVQKYFLNESSEELTHYQMIVDFMNDRGDEAEMPSVAGIDEEHETLLDIFQAAFDFEVELEEFYHEFYSSTSDIAVQQKLLSFIEIQRKSIGEYGDLIAKLELCGDDKSALLLFDHEING